MPFELLKSMSYFNLPAESNPDSEYNPCRELTAPEDFVVVKLDIDATATEIELVRQILAVLRIDPQLPPPRRVPPPSWVLLHRAKVTGHVSKCSRMRRARRRRLSLCDTHQRVSPAPASRQPLNRRSRLRSSPSATRPRSRLVWRRPDSVFRA